jgi:hypothetical protein
MSQFSVMYKSINGSRGLAANRAHNPFRRFAHLRGYAEMTEGCVVVYECCGSGNGETKSGRESGTESTSMLRFQALIQGNFEAMINRFLEFFARTSTRALWGMLFAITVAAAPAIARGQETLGAGVTAGAVQPADAQQQTTGTAQAGQTEQTSSQQQTPPPQTTPPAQSTGPDKDKKDEKADDPNNPKNDRIFLVIPNYGTVEHPTANIPPLTVKQKFKTGAEDAFDTYSVPLAGIVAAISQAKNDDAAWGQGWGAYGKRYAATYADTVIGSFMTTGVFPSLLHEDPRYFRMGSGGFRKRSWYALTRLFVIRTDAGKQQFNYSEFMGNATAAGISLTYHTVQERNFSSFAGDYATQIAIDAFANQLKEFWPDIRHHFSHKK